MSQPELPEDPAAEEAAPTFDKEAARARYRALMRSWPMRLMFIVTGLVLVMTWVLAFGSAYAPNVEKLPGHDITVGVAECKGCHNSGLNSAPRYNHAYAPTCGFCHRQGLPDQPLSGRAKVLHALR